MTKILFGLGVVLLSYGCSSTQNESTQTAKPVTKPAESQVPRTTEKPDPELQKQIEEIASVAKGRVGMAAILLENGAAVSVNARDHFPMQSVYKLPIGMTVMKEIDAGRIKLDQKVSITEDDFIGPDSHSPIRDKYPSGVELSVVELMGWMLKESDGTASDVLMKLAGGPSAIQSHLAELKISEMIVLDTEKALAQDHSLQFRNWASPESAVALLRALHERQGLSESSQSLLLKMMAESTPGAKRLKSLLPPGTVVAHKTGTSGTDKGVTAATNDIGIISLPNGKHIAIAVFVSDSPGDQKTREEVIAKIAKAVWHKWSKLQP